MLKSFWDWIYLLGNAILVMTAYYVYGLGYGYMEEECKIIGAIAIFNAAYYFFRVRRLVEHGGQTG